MSHSRNLARIARKGIITVNTAQELRDLPIYGGMYPEAVQTMGALSADDGGGGVWRWDNTSTETDDTGTTLLPTNFVDAGRWKRVLDENGIIPVAWFGAVGNTAVNESRMVDAACKFAWLQGGGTVLFESGKKYALAQVYCWPGVHFDFNYANIVYEPTYRMILESTQHAVFITQYGIRPYSNPYIEYLGHGKQGDFRYDTPNPYYGGATGSPPSVTWNDEQRPIDTTVLEYPVGTQTVVMASSSHGLVPGDWVWFASGDHIGTADTAGWQNYQHHEMELMKIHEVNGDQVTFTQPTRMTHRNLNRTAIQPGLSTYGAELFWFLHKLCPGSMSEGVNFYRLRTHVTAADQVNWTTTCNIFFADFFARSHMVDCRIHADDDCVYHVSNYARGVDRYLEDCLFTGKLRLCFGIDVAQVGFFANNCHWHFSTSEGFVHGGERFSTVRITNSSMIKPDDPAEVPNGTTWMFSEECEDVVLDNMHIHSHPGLIGCIVDSWGGWGSLTIRNCKFTGLWHGLPLFAKASAPNVNLTYENNLVRVTLAANQSAGNSLIMIGGRIINNDILLKNEALADINRVTRGSFFLTSVNVTSNVYHPKLSVVENNIGIGNLKHIKIDPSASAHKIDPSTAVHATTGIPLLDASSSTKVYVKANIKDDRYNGEARGMAWYVALRCGDAAPSGDIRFYFNVYDEAGVAIQYGLATPTFTIPEGTAQNDVFWVYASSFGASTAQLVQKENVTLLVQRDGANAADTCAQNISLDLIHVIAYRNDNVYPT